MFDPKIILVLAPHTDDGELGCGASIAKFAAASLEIHYTAFSICSKSLPKDLPSDTLARECKKATAILGIPAANLALHDFEVREFPAFRQQILEELVKLNKSIKPDLVFIPSSKDIHQDHGVVHTESLRAFKGSSLLGYELPWNHSEFNSTFFISVTKHDIAKKGESLKAYQSQSHRTYMQEEFIYSLAKVRGVQSNNEYAEAFEVYKIIS